MATGRVAGSGRDGEISCFPDIKIFSTAFIGLGCTMVKESFVFIVELLEFKALQSFELPPALIPLGEGANCDVSAGVDDGDIPEVVARTGAKASSICFCNSASSLGLGRATNLISGFGASPIGCKSSEKVVIVLSLVFAPVSPGTAIWTPPVDAEKASDALSAMASTTWYQLIRLITYVKVIDLMY